MAGPRSSVTRRYTEKCQHPNARDPGICRAWSVGEFDIPDDYKPVNRHPKQEGERAIPRPRARLCRRHSAMVAAHSRGEMIKGNSHEALCVICNHPRHAEILDRWENWYMTTTEVVLELDVTHATLYNHVRHFGLDAKKMAKPNRRRALLQVAERGLAAGDHSVRTGLEALKILDKIDNPNRHMTVDHNVSGAIGVGIVDFTRLSDEQLAEQMETLAKQLRETGAASKALPEGDDDDNVIDLAPSAVRHVAKPAKRSISRDVVQHGRR